VTIRSFGDRDTADLFHGRSTKGTRKFPSPAAGRKLDMLNAAKVLRDLAAPPGNRLEPLKGNLKGFHSIRVNDQYRIVFRWDEGAHDVRIVDYH
jgi:toxin HigB-1